MRALTLTQPFAGLVASGLKLIENRPRRMIKREDFGKPFAIHASREIDESVYARIAEIAPDVASLGVMSGEAYSEWYRLSRITSAVIAVATIDREVHSSGPDDVLLDADGSVALGVGIDQRRWFFGPVGYVLRDVVALPRAVPCRGWQGFWTLNAATEHAVRAQLVEAA